MERLRVGGLTLYFDALDREAAELIRRACEQSVGVIHEHWGLETPGDCRVYVMRSLLHFVYHSAPWSWRVLLSATLPLWYFRQRRIWPYAGGYEQRYGRRLAVGIKPPRLMQDADGSVGIRIFNESTDIGEKVERTTCHELAHAFVGHLNLPAWLKEGHAMVTVDEYMGKPTVKQETLDALARYSTKAAAAGYRKVSMQDQDAAIYLYTRGYWITRFLDDTQPALLRSLLQRRQSHSALEGEVAAALGREREAFWNEIDRMVIAHCGQGAEGKA
jgi:hypothetical protein